MLRFCLFPGPPRPFHLVIPKHATPFNELFVLSVSATSVPRRRSPKSLQNDGVSSTQQVGELGHTLLATLKSNPIPKSQQQQKQEEEGEEAQLSGSDVLWALQRASARKRKNKQEQKRGSSSVATPREEETAVDYTNVRPLCINPHWGAKLDELEERLRELSHTI